MLERCMTWSYLEFTILNDLCMVLYSSALSLLHPTNHNSLHQHDPLSLEQDMVCSWEAGALCNGAGSN